MGSWQEWTKDLQSLLDLLADLKVRRLGLARGRELSDRERAKVLLGVQEDFVCDSCQGFLKLSDWPTS